MLDDQFRFLMDKRKDKPTAYHITRVDPVSYAVGSERAEDGLIQWSVLEDQFNIQTDNAELMVANYYATVSGGTEETPGADTQLTLTDLDGDFKLAGGETKQIRVQLLDASGNPIVPFDYRLEYDFAGAASIVDETDGIITVQASEDSAFIGKRIELKAVNDTLGCEAVIKIQVVNW